MSNPTATRPAAANFRYAFDPHELDAIRECHDEHGFALVRRVITEETARAMRADIDRCLNSNNDLPPGDTRFEMAFIERSPALLSLLENEAFMNAARAVIKDDDITVNRSAAILKSPGAKAGGWHSDYDFGDGPVSDSLNRGEWPSGLWFYLTGSRPEHGGLAVIDGSHRKDWKGPEGFPLREDRKWFEPASGSWAGIDPFKDVPGVVNIVSEPTDLVIFAARTYHAPNAHKGDSPRYSATVVMRPRMKMNMTWGVTPEAEAFMATLPTHLKPYFEHYTGLPRK